MLYFGKFFCLYNGLEGYATIRRRRGDVVLIHVKNVLVRAYSDGQGNLSVQRHRQGHYASHGVRPVPSIYYRRRFTVHQNDTTLRSQGSLGSYVVYSCRYNAFVSNGMIFHGKDISITVHQGYDGVLLYNGLYDYFEKSILCRSVPISIFIRLI